MKTPRTRKEMIDYLSDHFRYDTMNSWNGATSYAANVKIHRLEFPSNEVRNRAYDLLQTDEAYDDVKFLMDEFAERHGYEWQMGFNGRSGGYIVLYQGGERKSDHKSVCIRCGQRNFTLATDENKRCGRCGADARVNREFHEIYTSPGVGTDQGESFEDWDTCRLRERVKLIMDFDRTVEACKRAFVQFCVEHKPEEETYQVPATRMIAVPA